MRPSNKLLRFFFFLVENETNLIETQRFFRRRAQSKGHQNKANSMKVGEGTLSMKVMGYFGAGFLRGSPLLDLHSYYSGPEMCDRSGPKDAGLLLVFRI